MVDITGPKVLAGGNSRGKTRIAELDVLRGFAAVTVVVFHFTAGYRVAYGPGHPALGIPYGVFAVHLFFMISGFVIFMTLSNTRTPLDFVVSRFSRLYPVFWAAVLITQTIVWLTGVRELSVTWREALVNLTMLAGPLHVRWVDNVYWSLVIELMFYVIMLGFFLVGIMKHIERLVVPWLLLQILAAIVSNVTLHAIPQGLAVLFLLKYAHLFLAGILCYRIRFEGPSRLRGVLFLCCLITQFAIQGIAAGFCSIIFFALFYALARERLAWIAASPLVFLGTISYSLYLVHYNVGFAMMRSLAGFPRLVQLTVASAVVLVLAVLLTFAVEQPALRFIRTWYKRVRKKEKIPVNVPAQTS